MLDDEVGRAALEGKAAREHLEEHAPERVEVDRGRGLGAARLLGRHVLGRAEHEAGRGDAQFALHLGQAEVEDLDEVAVLVVEQEDVVGLDVAVDDVELVGPGEGLGDLQGNAQAAVLGQASLGRDGAVEGDSPKVLHHEVAPAFGRLAEVGDVDDVLVVDAVGGLRLAQEAQAVGRVEAEIGGEELDGDVPLDDVVVLPVDGLDRAVDRAHAAGADALLDHVAPTDRLTDERVRKGH